MLTRLTRRRLWRAAIVAAFALGTAAAFAPAPANAAGGFSFGFGIGPGMFYDDEGEDYGGACLTDYLLRQWLAKDGYARIRLGLADEDHHMVVKADRNGFEYRLLVNSCSGKVLERSRIGAAR
jgi:hypothetical protein